MSERLVKQREKENRLKERWENELDVHHHEQILSMSFPVTDLAFEIDQGWVSRLSRPFFDRGEWRETFIRVIDIPVGQSIRKDIIFDYGRKTKGVVNIPVSKAIYRIIKEFRNWFLVGKIRIVTFFGTLGSERITSTPTKIIWKVKKKPKVRE